VEQQQQVSLLMEQARLMAVQSAVINGCWVLAKLFANKTAQTVLVNAAEKPQLVVGKLLLSMLQGRTGTAWLARQLWFVRGHGLKMRWQVLLYHSLAKPLVITRNWLQRVIGTDTKRG